MRHKTIKQFALILSLLLLTVWGGANDIRMMDGFSPIHVKEGNVQGTPKGSTIQAYIDGHVLSITFTENLGEVAINVTTASGSPVDYLTTQTPHGVILFIPLAGDYIVTFTLPNGDEYYGEFTVTD